MNKRLNQFLELEDLSPSQFAEIMGIQRSSVSHILSERNKPSYDFIEKMLTKFPQISAEWLILGKGKPYKEQNVSSPQILQHNLFSQFSENKESIPQNATPEPPQNRISDDVSRKTPENFSEKVISEAPVNASGATQSQVPPPVIASGAPSVIASGAMQSHPRRITRITIFYSDGTFEER